MHEGLVQDGARAHGHVHNETGARNSLAAAALALIKLSHTLESAGANVNFCVAIIIITTTYSRGGVWVMSDRWWNTVV